MKISVAQTNPIIGDFNYQKTIFKDAISKAVFDQADLLIFPELSAIGYPVKDLLFDSFFLEKQDIFVAELIAMSSKIEGLGILFGAVKVEGQRLYNSAFLIFEGKCIFNTSKFLLPNNDVFDEKRYFSSNSNFNIINFKNNRLAITICEDLWVENFECSPIHNLMNESPTLLINLSASPFYLNKSYKRYLRVNDVVSQYKVPVIVANQVGGQDDLIFDGESFIINKNGECIMQLSAFKSDQATVSLDETPSKNFTIKSENESLLDALVCGINDYFKKTGFTNAVIGLSGGIDSAVCYVLACLALGPNHVTPIMLASPFTSNESVRDAQEMARFQASHLVELPISNLYESSINCLSDELDMSNLSLTHENIQARLRAVLLMAFSNHANALLLNTGNKSELAMGYSTLYGDMCGALSILGDVLKTQVFDLARYLNDLYPGCIPEYVITRPPSAELKPNQTDQDSLPDYEEVDAFVQANLNTPYKYELDSLELRQRFVRNEYKRSQAPIVLKVSKKAFGPGRRFPIAAKYL